MTEPNSQQSKAKRVLTNATKLALFFVMVGIAVQAGMTFFEDRPGGAIAAEETTPEGDLGDWTFAGEGLGVSVRTIDAGELETELRGREPAVVDPKVPVFNGEKQLLELLATQPPSKKGEDGRQSWRQSIGGIEVFAETCKVGGADRLAVARAAWAKTETGLSLVEIRPEAVSSGNERSAKRPVRTPKGATEMAQRVTKTGVVTGSLMTTRGSLEDAGNAITASLTGDGWSVEPVEMGKVVSAKTMACRRGDDRWQVVVFRDGHVADQTMIMCVRE